MFLVKLTLKFFPEDFSAPAYLFYRNIVLILISLYFINSSSIVVTKLNEVKNKYWFLMRLFGNYFGYVTSIMCIFLLRLSTAQSINSIHPAIVLVLSIIVLKEKFYWRYLMGILIGFIGTLMIIFTEREQIQHIDQNKVKCP